MGYTDTSLRTKPAVTLHRRTATGVPIRVKIDDFAIRAYREEPAEIVSHSFGADGSAVVEVNAPLVADLVRYMSATPVMEITRRGGDFVVDFEAGFQRGRITVGRDELTKRSQWPRPGPGYLKWIGLSARDAEIRGFLGTQ